MTPRWLTPAGLHTAEAKLPVEGRLPSFDGPTGWLNSPPLTPAGLRGRVVLVNFWTYTCINWLRQLPYVRAWAEKYRSQGLIVLGVHTPEFPFEHDADNVRRAVKDMKIDYPVATDNGYEVWQAFDNHFWPALYFVDAQGRIRHHNFGEGEYQQSEMVLQQLLVDAGAEPGTDLVSPDAGGIEAAADWASLRTPETYTGYGRTEGFASPGGIRPDRPHVYAPPERLHEQVGPVRRMDSTGTGSQGGRRRRPDHLSFPGPRPAPRDGTGGTGNLGTVPGAPGRATARPRSRRGRGRPRPRHAHRAAAAPTHPPAGVHHRTHLRDHLPRPRRTRVRLHVRVDKRVVLPPGPRYDALPLPSSRGVPHCLPAQPSGRAGMVANECQPSSGWRLIDAEAHNSVGPVMHDEAITAA